MEKKITFRESFLSSTQHKLQGEIYKLSSMEYYFLNVHNINLPFSYKMAISVDLKKNLIII